MDAHRLATVGLVIWAISGCVKPQGGSVPPTLHAHRSATFAIAELDANADGLVDRSEARKCPALAQAFEKYDENRDGNLSHAEIAKRLRTFARGRLATASVTFQVFLEDAPLVGAEVLMEPERFLDCDIKPAEGLTDVTGVASPRTAELGTAGVYCGLYRLRISWKDAQGREQLPARYNTETELGQEVAPDLPETIIILRLTRM